MENYRKLKAALPLTWHHDDYVLVGSAILAAYERRDVVDLDVLIRPKLWPDIFDFGTNTIGPAFVERERATLPGWDDTYEDSDPARRVVRIQLFDGGIIDFFDSMPRIAKCITPEMVWNDSLILDRVRVVSPRHCLAVKALAKREKDHNDMIVLASMIQSYESAMKGVKPIKFDEEIGF